MRRGIKLGMQSGIKCVAVWVGGVDVVEALAVVVADEW